MQVFVIGNAWESALALDNRRRNKQIIEIKQILSALNGDSKAWRNHPCTIQYEKHQQWLRNYLWILQEVSQPKYDWVMVQLLNIYCEEHKPWFHIKEYFDQMKRRLYTKDKEYYKQWADLGESEINWYYDEDNQIWKYYKNGKRIN